MHKSLEREFYMKMSRKNGWTYRVLIHHIEMATFENTMMTQSNFNKSPPTNLRPKAARARGRKGGRPKGLTEAAKRKAVAAKALYNEGNLSVTEIAGNLGISKGTLYCYLRHERTAVGTFRKQSTIADT
jgi:Helix-turn-helix domain of resolvase